MPRVATKTKSNRGKPYTCIGCRKPIVAGEEYSEWSFFRSSPSRKHTACGRPRQSELTQSKLSSVYAAMEDAEVSIASATEKEDIASALESVAQAARDVAEEYQEAMDAMGAAGEGGSNEERKDALEEFADELENAQSEIEQAERDEEDKDETAESFIEGLRDQATDALQSLSL